MLGLASWSDWRTSEGYPPEHSQRSCPWHTRQAPRFVSWFTNNSLFCAVKFIVFDFLIFLFIVVILIFSWLVCLIYRFFVCVCFKTPLSCFSFLLLFLFVSVLGLWRWLSSDSLMFTTKYRQIKLISSMILTFYECWEKYWFICIILRTMHTL